MRSQDETLEIISALENSTRQLIYRHQEVIREMQSLRSQLQQREEQIRSLNDAAKRDKQAYEQLKMAKFLDAMDDDAHSTRTRITKMIATIDKCIAILKSNE